MAQYAPFFALVLERLCVFSLLLCLSLSLGARGDDFRPVRVQVPVSNQQADSRKNAPGEALQVIVKVTGNSNALQNPDIQAQAQQAERYIKACATAKPLDNSLQLDVILPKTCSISSCSVISWLFGAKPPAYFAMAKHRRKRPTQITEPRKWPLAGLIEQAFDERGLPVLWPYAQYRRLENSNAQRPRRA